MEHIVIIESLVGDFEIKTDLPSGKPYVVKWVQDKNTPDVHPTAEVPTVLWYVDEFQKRKKVARENLAQEDRKSVV